MTKPKKTRVVPVVLIEQRIYSMRGRKVILDADLALMYGVTTKALNQAVRRNPKRFPDEFMFQLSTDEAQTLNWSQTVTSSRKHRGIRYLPLAFTEHGVAMLSSVLRSERAVQMNVLIIKAFIKIRELLTHNRDLAVRIDKLEAGQKEHRSIIAILAEEIDSMKRLPAPKSRGIGFTANLDE